MKAVILFLIIFAFPPLAFSQLGWQNINSGTMEELYSIRILDSLNILAVGNHGTVIISADGGENWDSSDLSIEESINCIDVFDSVTAYIGGSNGKLYRTDDAGKSWTLIPTTSNRGITEIKFIDPNTGFFCMPYPFDPNDSRMFKTTNGGINWLEILGGPFLYQGTFSKFDFPTSENGYIGGYYDAGLTCFAKINRTSNTGVTWQTTSTANCILHCSDVTFLNKDTGFFCYGYSLLKTMDRGLTFNYYPYPGGYEICFPSTNVGYLCTGSYIHKTIDNGNTWFKQIPTNIYNSIDFINELTGFACGKNGMIMRTRTGGDTTKVQINNNEIKLPFTFKLFQNYPNPFNPNTKIRFDLPADSKVKLIVYDLLGREIIRLINVNIK
ncbi:MAG: YCF48-related protein [Bacteroidota bacterium]|nr:YCF48-related protein [Bacteroidota bacterium]